eukprot:Selendium_serpulae@DN2888_c1_g1_i1.p1
MLPTTDALHEIKDVRHATASSTFCLKNMITNSEHLAFVQKHVILYHSIDTTDFAALKGVLDLLVVFFSSLRGYLSLADLRQHLIHILPEGDETKERLLSKAGNKKSPLQLSGGQFAERSSSTSRSRVSQSVGSSAGLRRSSDPHLAPLSAIDVRDNSEFVHLLVEAKKLKYVTIEAKQSADHSTASLSLPQQLGASVKDDDVIISVGPRLCVEYNFRKARQRVARLCNLPVSVLGNWTPSNDDDDDDDDDDD